MKIHFFQTCTTDEKHPNQIFNFFQIELLLALALIQSHLLLRVAFFLCLQSIRNEFSASNDLLSTSNAFADKLMKAISVTNFCRKYPLLNYFPFKMDGPIKWFQKFHKTLWEILITLKGSQLKSFQELQISSRCSKNSFQQLKISSQKLKSAINS